MLQTIQNLMEQYVFKIQNIYGDHLRQIILYGSYARGDFSEDSDIDIMILQDMSHLELKKYSQQLAYMTYDFSLDHDVEIKPIAKSEKFFERWVANYPFFIKTEIFSREIGRKIGEAEEIRHASDYDNFYTASREETERQIETAGEFIQTVGKYCMRQLENG